MNPYRYLLAAVLFAALSVNAFADFGEGLTPADAPKPLTNLDGQHNHWTGIGRIRNPSHTPCTASLLDTRDAAGNATGPAYVLTSNDCFHRSYAEQPSDSLIRGQISFNYFDDTLDNLKTYQLRTLKWRSQVVDLALIELKSPLKKLIADGITPLKLAQDIPPEGTDILTVTAPEWETLLLSACTRQAQEDVSEQSFVWPNVLRNQCNGITHGGLGGPLLERNTNALFALISSTTTNASPDNKCLRDSPCEIKEGTALLRERSNYASPATLLNGCFTSGQFHADAQDCALPDSTLITLASDEAIPPHIPYEPDGAHKNKGPVWDLDFSLNKAFYRYKTTRTAKECESPTGYSQAFNAKNGHIHAPLTPQMGLHMLCIVGFDTAHDRATHRMMKGALVLAAELTPARATRLPDMSISLDRSGSQVYSVLWFLRPPLISRYTYKLGPAHSTDCLQASGYRDFPPPITSPEPEDDDAIDLSKGPLNDGRAKPYPVTLLHLLDAAIQPMKVCTYAHDRAGKPSALRVDVLKPR